MTDQDGLSHFDMLCKLMSCVSRISFELEQLWSRLDWSSTLLVNLAVTSNHTMKAEQDTDMASRRLTVKRTLASRRANKRKSM